MELATVFLEKGANPQYFDVETSKTPLDVAVDNGHFEMVKHLFRRGASMGPTLTKSVVNLLWIACSNGDKEVLQLLLQQCKDLNMNVTRVEDGATPLCVVVQNGNIDLTQLLIQYGCDVNKPKNAGCTPLFIACQNGFVEIAQCLIQNKADPNLCRKIFLFRMWIKVVIRIGWMQPVVYQLCY